MTKLHIRAIAAKIMEELCYVCNSNFAFINFNAFSLFNEAKISRTDIIKASKYLTQHQYIIGDELASENWKGSITASGIDWVEDYLNINHTI